MNWEKWQDLMEVERPIRYVGGEWNQIKKDPEKAKVSWALSFPDVYEVGMSHLGLKILFYLLECFNIELHGNLPIIFINTSTIRTRYPDGFS